MRNRMRAAFAVIGLIGLCGTLTYGQQAGRGGRGAPAPAVPRLATDKTMFWTAADIEARWKENESLKRINSRIYDGPANISANVRIVLPGDPPQTHEGTADLWLVTAGEAVARTDGEIIEASGTKTIRNGMSRPVHAGDLLYVPPGVPHVGRLRRPTRRTAAPFVTFVTFVV